MKKTIAIMMTVLALCGLCACTAVNSGVSLPEETSQAFSEPTGEPADTINPAVTDETAADAPAEQGGSETAAEAEKTVAPSGQTADHSADQQTLTALLTQIDQNTTVGTAGSFMTAVSEAADLLDFGGDTALTTDQIKSTVSDWLMDQGNDAQTAFSEKLSSVDDACQQLQDDGAADLLSSAGCENSAYPWNDNAFAAADAVMDAVGLR